MSKKSCIFAAFFNQFWRTKSQQEIDYIEESDGQMSAFEMKWNLKKGNTRLPETFLSAYDIKKTAVITPENYWNWLVNQ